MQIKELITNLFKKPSRPLIQALPVQLDEIQWLLKREERLAKSKVKEGSARQ